ncbi:MAG: PH domain-containing protein [Candidatus Aenigmarchaeota archaeon]|nr:PH domain-containing protein [Candidatus Aenigmarchaeota archaeon]
MDDEQEEFVLKTSRIFFLGNYIIAFLVGIFLVLAIISFKLTFTFFPSTLNDLLSTLTILGIAALGLTMIEQPEWARFREKFVVTMNEVIREHGIFTRERVILPYATIADISVHRSVIGRILNYGTISVSSFKSGSDMVMHGIRSPEKYHVIIQNRVNLIREGQIRMFKEEKMEGKSESEKAERKSKKPSKKEKD